MERNKPLGRGKPLDRGSGPARKTPMGRKTPMRSGGPIDRDARPPREPTVPKPRTGQGEKLAAQERRLRTSQDVVRQRSQDPETELERCERCARPGRHQCHHRDPRGMGGSQDPAIHSPANLLHLCLDCHAWVESNRTEADALGLLVLHAEDPAAKPVETIYGRVFLTDDGGLREAA